MQQVEFAAAQHLLSTYGRPCLRIKSVHTVWQPAQIQYREDGLSAVFTSYIC
jgi:hypothetical protein